MRNISNCFEAVIFAMLFLFHIIDNGHIQKEEEKKNVRRSFWTDIIICHCRVRSNTIHVIARQVFSTFTCAISKHAEVISHPHTWLVDSFFLLLLRLKKKKELSSSVQHPMSFPSLPISKIWLEIDHTHIDHNRESFFLSSSCYYCTI